MTLLAIDTSGAYASVAIFDGRTVLAEETWYARRRHDDQLFGAIERAMTLAGMDLAALTRVAVASGPGSFTGLRVGIAAAQGLARASGSAVIGVPTLDAIAHPFAAAGQRVCAVVPAGRGEVYAAIYRHRGGAWSRVSGIDALSPAGLARRLVARTLVAGEIDEALAEALRGALGERAIVVSPAARVRRAADLAEVAWARAEAGQAVAPESLEPLYLRAPVIRDGSGLAGVRG